MLTRASHAKGNDWAYLTPGFTLTVLRTRKAACEGAPTGSRDLVQ